MYTRRSCAVRRFGNGSGTALSGVASRVGSNAYALRLRLWLRLGNEWSPRRAPSPSATPSVKGSGSRIRARNGGYRCKHSEVIRACCADAPGRAVGYTSMILVYGTRPRRVMEEEREIREQSVGAFVRHGG